MKEKQLKLEPNDFLDSTDMERFIGELTDFINEEFGRTNGFDINIMVNNINWLNEEIVGYEVLCDYDKWQDGFSTYEEALDYANKNNGIRIIAEIEFTDDSGKVLDTDYKTVWVFGMRKGK